MKKFFARARAVLEDKGGEGYVDTAVKMIIAVVIGALLLGGLYYIFNTLILPGLAERIQDNRIYQNNDNERVVQTVPRIARSRAYQKCSASFYFSRT